MKKGWLGIRVLIGRRQADAAGLFLRLLRSLSAAFDLHPEALVSQMPCGTFGVPAVAVFAVRLPAATTEEQYLEPSMIEVAVDGRPSLGGAGCEAQRGEGSGG